MNILRKLATLIRAMASPGTDAPAAGPAPAEAEGAGVAPAAEDAQRTMGKRGEVPGQPLDRSRVADLLDQQAQGQEMPAQRQKGDRS